MATSPTGALPAGPQLFRPPGLLLRERRRAPTVHSNSPIPVGRKINPLTMISYQSQGRRGWPPIKLTGMLTWTNNKRALMNVDAASLG